MSTPDKAVETQLKNIQTKTGQTLEQLFALIAKSQLTKHGQIRDHLKTELGLGHGDANTIAHCYFKSLEQPAEPAGAQGGPAEALDGIYTGKKAALRPIHEKLMAAIQAFGPFEIAPKKTYVSLRRKKQFAMIGPASQTRVEVGLNCKELVASERILAMPPGGMCSFKVNVSTVEEVDQELIEAIRQAYTSAG